MTIPEVLMSQGYTHIALPAGPLRLSIWIPADDCELLCHGAVLNDDVVLRAVTYPVAGCALELVTQTWR